jgi:outer membrane protein OmpA-like peptidoglycan-associated protein
MDMPVINRLQLRSTIVLVLVLLSIASCSTRKTVVVLLPDEGGPQGAVAVNEGSNTVVLDSPMTKAEVGASGRVSQSTISQQDVDSDFARAIAAQPPEPISFTLYFEEGSTVVLDASRETLSALFDEVARRQAIEVQVTGHTDTVGNRTDNDTLSTNRALVIKEMLVDQGLQADFIRAVGRGERELLVETDDDVSEPKNRRVEVIVR